MLTPYIIARSLFDDVEEPIISGRYVSDATAGGMLRTDIKETENGYELIVDIPGIRKENVSVELKDGYLILEAGTGKDDRAAGEKYLRRERSVGTFRRSFYIGERFTQEDVRGQFGNDGTLHIFIARAAREQAGQKRTITIED